MQMLPFGKYTAKLLRLLQCVFGNYYSTVFEGRFVYASQDYSFSFTSSSYPERGVSAPLKEIILALKFPFMFFQINYAPLP